MRILHINSTQSYGGAETIMRALMDECAALGVETSCLIGRIHGEADAAVNVFDHDGKRSLWSRMCLRIADWLWSYIGGGMHGRGICRFIKNVMGQPLRSWNIFMGKEDFAFPDSVSGIERVRPCPDVLHFHSFHSEFFDLRALIKLGTKWKIVVTLHDSWMITGHCAYPGACERYKVGCGDCPDLDRFPKVRKDRTAYNFQRKQSIYNEVELHLVAPSRWMMSQVESSALGSCFVNKRVIPNGIDTAVFTPGCQVEARQRWGLPPGVPVLLYVARNARSSPYKDYATVEKAMQRVAARCKGDIHLLVLGDEGEREVNGNSHIHFALTTERDQIIAAYRAADVYLHAAAAENFPTTVLEAMACGVPVVATRTGGIPEQVIDQKTGRLVEPGDDSSMASAIQELLNDDELKAAYGAAGRKIAVESYDQSVMSGRYIEWYKEICGA